MLIKVRYMKDDVPFGRPYTFKTDYLVKVGDVVYIDLKAKGVVTEIDVPESEIADFKDKVKTIVGKVADDDRD